jgi:hypothetical protein
MAVRLAKAVPLVAEKGGQKSGALAWEQEPRVTRFHLSVSFSHRRVGSSILASLSEAGGNEP